uniref:Rhodanese domain-containing protein n=1 Tax=Peronospora matthiolae TaxID=2874970 RepID=A0AAV1VL76_9STRA
MDRVLDQLSVHVSGEPEVSPDGATCVQRVAKTCGLKSVTYSEEAKNCRLAGFTDTKQQLAVASMLYWTLQVVEESSVLVSVSNSAAGTRYSLAEMLNRAGMSLQDPEVGAVKVLDAAAFVKEVLQQENGEMVQILDCREQEAFLGLVSGKEVSGHLKGAKNVPFASIFTAQSDAVEETKDVGGVMVENPRERSFLLPVNELRSLFEMNGIDLANPVAVVASVPAEAAAVATALLVAGQRTWLAFCIDALRDELVALFPVSYTSEIFHGGGLLYKDDKGEFDLSIQQNDARMTEGIDKTAVAELEKAYKEKLIEITRKDQEATARNEEKEEKVSDVVWIQDGHRFFDMPHPVSKDEFLDASRTIYRVVSFVLAPFGFPASLRRKRSSQEVKTQCGSLFQDVVEVCSDLIYQQKELTEGSMAMSVHKWVEKKRDNECMEQLKAINDLWDVLYTPPTVVEIPDVSDEYVLNLATKLGQKMRDLVSQRTPWACDSVDEGEEGESSGEEDFEPQISREQVDSLDEEELGEEETDEVCKESKAYSEEDTSSEDTDKQDKTPEEAEDVANKAEAITKEGVVFENELPSNEDESSVEDDTTNARNVNDDRAIAETEDRPAVKNEFSVDEDGATGSGSDSRRTIKSLSGRERFERVESGLAESWKYMYPSVVYSLGFIPRDVVASHKKLSTLQIKSLIQAIAEASWDVIKDGIDGISQIEFQALCETVDSEKREQLADRVAEAEKSVYVLKHFLARPLKSDISLADKLVDVREAVVDGDIRRRSGNYQAALEAYSKAFSHLPLYHKELEHAVVGRARSLLDMKEVARAKTEAFIALKLNPYSIGAYECLGIVEEETEHIEAAMQHYVTSFILDGSRSLELAESIDRTSRLVGRRVAKDLFAKMEKMHNLPSQWLVNSYFESFEHDVDHAARLPIDIEKKEDVEQAELDGQTLLYRAVHFKRRKDFKNVQHDIEALVSRDMEAEGLSVEDRALAFNLYASLLYVAGDVHTAVEVIDQSLELQPTLVNSLVKKGGFLAELGDPGEATSCFTMAMDLELNEADVHLHYGQMKLLDGKYTEAVQSLRRCISRSDTLPVTYVSYGMALYKSGSTYQANDLFKEASKKFPDSAEVHLFHGEVEADQGNYADAMRHFLTAWELSPQCPLPFLNAGRVYVSTNDPMRAIAHFQQALTVDPRCSSAHLDIAQVLFAQGRTSEAFEHFERAAACCRFLPEVEEACACQEMAKMQLKVTEILGVELRHIMRSK